MSEALLDLDQQLRQRQSRLIYLSGHPNEILQKFLPSHDIDAVFVNRDYTPFSRRRDSQIKNVCKKTNVVFHQFADCLLNEPEMVLKTNGQPYKVFTPYFRQAAQNPVATPKEEPQGKYSQIETSSQHDLKRMLRNLRVQTNKMLFVQGTRSACEKILNDINCLRDYERIRNFPSHHGTTRLSAYIKFGLCSIREVYKAIKNKLGPTHPLIRQLYWRDFYVHVAFHYPYIFKRAFKPRYKAIQWNYNKASFQRWCEGKTGFPIVDAGMRELNTTGWMHNRVRMIVASFLTKDLHIDWRWGERYFAEHLIDYDPAVNNGNWQWSASTGVDAQPYFRIFNPWLQQQKYDKNCDYIKKWIPELSEVDTKDIHHWFNPTKWDSRISYPKPMVDHKEESQYSRELFAKSSSKR